MEIADPNDAPPLRWGVLGAGFIAGKFVNAVTKHTGSQVSAVGSRDLAKAREFADEHGIPVAHGGYDALVADDRVDAVYVATPHSHHLEHALLAIGAGRPVLIEKPIARNAAEATIIARAAAEAGVFAMEAMWTRFLPHMVRLREVLADGQLGEVVHMHADHAQRFAFDPSHRIYDPALAGGALLDLGVYPVSFVHDVLGSPISVSAAGVLTETGVDANVALALGFEGRARATVGTSLWALGGIDATITGTEARVYFDGPFLRPTVLHVVPNGGEPWSFDGTARNGFQYEVAEVARCVAAGLRESPVLPLADSIAVLATLDAARAQLGVRYPGEADHTENDLAETDQAATDHARTAQGASRG